jgi:hypothetical protein
MFFHRRVVFPHGRWVDLADEGGVPEDVEHRQGESGRDNTHKLPAESRKLETERTVRILLSTNPSLKMRLEQVVCLLIGAFEEIFET